MANVMHRSIGALRAILLGLALALPAAQTHAQGEATEAKIKAAFVFKFAGFVEWPAGLGGGQAPVVIGVLADDAVANELMQLVPGRTVDNRPIIVKRIESRDQLAGLHILFIGRSEMGQLPHISPVLHAHSTLIVTESESALAQGSIINFLVVDRKVKFEVSLEAAEKSRLKLSSRLLAVASKVIGGRDVENR